MRILLFIIVIILTTTNGQSTESKNFDFDGKTYQIKVGEDIKRLDNIWQCSRPRQEKDGFYVYCTDGSMYQFDKLINGRL